MSEEALIVLGSGCGVPSAKRGAPGLLLASPGQLMLIDAGPGTLHRLARAGFDASDLDLVLFTHLHLDHIAEIPFLLFSLRIPFGEPRTKPLALVGPPGLSDHYRRLSACYGRHVMPAGYELAVVEAGRDGHAMGGFRLEALPMKHTESSVGYRITTPGGKVVAVSGDTDLCPELAALGRKADLLVLECSMPDGLKATGHLTPSEAGQAATDAGARRLLLVHFYPPCDEEDMALQASKAFPGEVMAAEDLMRIELG